MDIHKSCSSLSIFALDKIFSTGDNRYLIKKYKPSKDIILTKQQEIDFELVFKKIVHEYGELTVNRNIIKNYKLQLEITLLEFKYNTTTRILNLFSEYNEIEVLLLLLELGWNFNIEDDINDQLLVLSNKMKGLSNKIRINKVNYEKQFKEHKNAIKINIDKEALQIEIALGLHRRIEPKKTTVVEWVNLNELVSEKSKQYG